MQIFYFAGGGEADELRDLEDRIRRRFPSLEKVERLEELRQRPRKNGGNGEAEPSIVVLPVLAAGSALDRLIALAEQEHGGFFFIFVSPDISATDYKRLVRNRSADWASLRDAPREIEEIVSRVARVEAPLEVAASTKPAIAAFMPAGGGVGNTTLAIEAAIQLKALRQMRHRRVCLVDLDLQTSHVCDYLDMEPRLQMREIIEQPERLDSQLFDLFVSRHASGIDVLASPRTSDDADASAVAALDALFSMIAQRYEVVIVDLPPHWSIWTRQILSVCNLLVVSGFNTVPGLRQVADTLRSARSLDPAPQKIVVALNRCEPKFPGKIARAQHIRKILPDETVVTVREDRAAAIDAVNTGVPVSVGSPSSRIAKDVKGLSTLIADLSSVQA